MVSAWSTANSLVLGQEKTSEKSNEITAIPELLDVLDLKGCIVSIDAIGCQTEIAKKITNKEADYILALKGVTVFIIICLVIEQQHISSIFSTTLQLLTNNQQIK